MKTRYFSSKALILPGLFVVLFAAGLARGGSTSTWSGSGSSSAPSSGNFSSSSSWGGTGPNFATSATTVYNDLTLDFSGSGSTAYTANNDLNTGFAQLVTLKLDSTATVAETISGNNLVFVGTSAQNGTNPGSTINENGSGSFIISSNISLPAVGGSGALTLAGTGTGTVTLGGTISGPAVGITVTSGNWIISGANTNASGGGRYTQSGGTVDIQNATALGSTAVPVANSFGPWLQAGTLESTTGVTVATYSGEKTTGQGVAGIALGNVTLTGPVNWSLGSSTFVLRNGSNNADTLTVNTGGTTGTTIGGALVDGSSASTLKIASASTGILTLSGASTFTGGTTISGGVVSITGTSSASFTQAATTTSSNTVTTSSTANLVAGETVSGTGIPAGAVVTTIVDATHFTISANASAGSNTLTFGGYSGLGTGAITVGSGGTLALGSNGLASGAGNMTISGTGFAGQGGALVNAAGTNTYSGLITLGAAAAISSNGGTLNITNAGTITGSGLGLTLTGTGNGALASSIGTVGGGLTKSGTGTWTLTGASTYTGGTTVNAGTLLVSNTTSGGSATGSGALVVKNGATIGGYGRSSGTSFGISGTGTATGQRASVLVGMNWTSDNNISQVLTLVGSGTSTITNASLTFNLNAKVAGGLGGTSNGGSTGGLGAANSGTELSVGSTAISFGTGQGSVILTLNLQNEPYIVGAFTPYVLIAGTMASGGGGDSDSQYTGLTLGTVLEKSGGITETIIGGNNIALAFGTSLDQQYYGANSYLVLYQNTNTNTDDIVVIVVPEPSTWALMIGGLVTLVFWQRRRSKHD